MAKLRFMSENLYDTAYNLTLNFSPPYDANGISLGADNLKLISRSSVLRTDNAIGTKTISGNLATNSSIINGFAVGRHNLSENGAIRLILYDEINQTGNIVYDSGAIQVSLLYGWGNEPWGIFPWGGAYGAGLGNPLSQIIVIWIANAVLATSFTIEMVDTTNVYGYIQASRVFLGQYIEPIYNISHGHSLSIEDDSSQFRTDGGTLRSQVTHLYKKLEFKLSVISPADRNRFTLLFARTGKRKDILISVYPQDSNQVLAEDYTMIGKLVKTPIMKEIIGGYYTANFSMEEV